MQGNGYRFRRSNEGVEMRRVAFVLGSLVTAVVVAATPALATSAHFNVAQVTSVTSNSITVSFKEAGRGNTLISVNTGAAVPAECITGGTNHPRAGNKAAESAPGPFNVSNGQAPGSPTMPAPNLNCPPPMTIAWT